MPRKNLLPYPALARVIRQLWVVTAYLATLQHRRQPVASVQCVIMGQVGFAMMFVLMRTCHEIPVRWSLTMVCHRRPTTEPIPTMFVQNLAVTILTNETMDMHPDTMCRAMVVAEVVVNRSICIRRVTTMICLLMLDPRAPVTVRTGKNVIFRTLSFLNYSTRSELTIVMEISRLLIRITTELCLVDHQQPSILINTMIRIKSFIPVDPERLNISDLRVVFLHHLGRVV